MKIKRVGNHSFPLPRRAHDSAGYDLIAAENAKIFPGTVAVVPTGFAWEITPTPKRLKNVTLFGMIKDRSGVATKTGLHVVAGVVDGDYRGEVMVALRNSGDEPEMVVAGTRIAQLVLIHAITPGLEEAENLDDTIRADGAMGSTGESDWADTSTEDNYMEGQP